MMVFITDADGCMGGGLATVPEGQVENMAALVPMLRHELALDCKRPK